MLKKISDWYMKQRVGHILITMYFIAAITATIIIPDGSRMVLWAWGAGAACVVGPFLLSINHTTKKITGKNIWD